MTFEIDVSDIDRFTKAMDTVPDRLNREIGRTVNGLMGLGVQIARDKAPRKTGHLARNIRVHQTARLTSTGATGRFGVYKKDVIYARIRERGGVIRARYKPYLVFQVNGRWVRTKQVRQKGSWYMQRTRRELKPRIKPAMRRGLDRVFAGVA